MGTDQQNEAAAKTKVDQSTISRWRNSGKPGRVESVVAFARGYGISPLTALMEAGYITEIEARQRPARELPLESVTDEQLVGLIAARLGVKGSGSGARNASAIKAPELGPGHQPSAVASDPDGTTPEQAQEADEVIARAKAKQQEAIDEMERNRDK